MEAIRKIVQVKNNSFKIKLPENFKANKVEVIILPIEEKSKTKGIASLRGKLNLSPEQYNELQEDVKNSRKFADIQIKEKKSKTKNVIEEDNTYETMLLSEKGLAEDWLSDEDNRWDEVL